MSRSSSYIRRILSAADDDSTANQILKSIRQNRSLQDLDELLCHSDDKVVEAAVWILAELADDGRPLINRARELVEHSSINVRFSLIDVVLLCARDDDADLIAWALTRCTDLEAAVRWKSMVFMHDVSESLLFAAQAWMNGKEDWREHVLGIRLLLTGPSSECRESNLGSSSHGQIISSYCAAAAARYYSIDTGYLEEYARNRNQEIRNFAQDMLVRCRIKGG